MVVVQRNDDNNDNEDLGLGRNSMNQVQVPRNSKW